MAKPPPAALERGLGLVRKIGASVLTGAAVAAAASRGVKAAAVVRGASCGNVNDLCVQVPDTVVLAVTAVIVIVLCVTGLALAGLRPLTGFAFGAVALTGVLALACLEHGLGQPPHLSAWFAPFTVVMFALLAFAGELREGSSLRGDRPWTETNHW